MDGLKHAKMANWYIPWPIFDITHFVNKIVTNECSLKKTCKLYHLSTIVMVPVSNKCKGLYILNAF